MKRYLPLIILIIGFAIAGSAGADTVISKDVQKIVQRIAESGRVTISGTRREVQFSPEWENLRQLRKKATTEELRILTDNPNPVIRCCAFWALTRDSAEGIFELVVRHIQDTASVLVYSGGDGSNQPVGDFFIRLVTGDYAAIRGNSANRTNLTAIEQRRLDSVLIFEPNNLLSKSSAVLRAEPVEWMYPRIRELVQKEQYHPALKTLARYHKDQDVPLMIEFLKTSRHDTAGFASNYTYDFGAIRAFPHPAFLPFLEDELIASLDSMRLYKYELYDAIAAYQNADAVRLFGIACTAPKDWTQRSWNCIAAFYSIWRNLCPAYDSLLFVLWDTRQLISSDVFEHLARADSGRTLELARISLKHPYDIRSGNSMDNWPSEQDALGDMIDYVMKRDAAFAVRAVRDGLGIGGTAVYFTFVRAAKEYRDTSFVEPLFRKIQGANYPDDYLKAVDVLLSYSDTAVDRRLKEIVESNDRLKRGWGGDSLKVLLKRRGTK